MQKMKYLELTGGRNS